MSNRFLKFENTSLYEQFGKVLDVEPELVMDTEYDYYKDTFTYLQDTFCCDHKPTSTQIDTYITNNENISEKAIDEFKTLIYRIFEKYIVIVKLLKKITTKRILKERDNIEKNEQKNRIKQYNMALIKCECGMEHVRTFAYNHKKSIEHKYRMDGINYYKNNNYSLWGGRSLTTYTSTDMDSVITDDNSLDSYM
jgi:hypothetical protein